MHNYIVSYDLRAPHRDYKSLDDALQKLAARPVLQTVWVVVLAETGQANALGTMLRPHTDANDGLLVVEELDQEDWGKNLL